MQPDPHNRGRRRQPREGQKGPGGPHIGAPRQEGAAHMDADPGRQRARRLPQDADRRAPELGPHNHRHAVLPRAHAVPGPGVPKQEAHVRGHGVVRPAPRARAPAGSRGAPAARKMAGRRRGRRGRAQARRAPPGARGRGEGSRPGHAQARQLAAPHTRAKRGRAPRVGPDGVRPRRPPQKAPRRGH